MIIDRRGKEVIQDGFTDRAGWFSLETNREKNTEKTHTSLLHTPSHITGRDSVHKEDVEGISTIGGGVLPKCSRFGSGLGRELRKTGKAYKGESRDRIPNVAGFSPWLLRSLWWSLLGL